MPDGPGAAPRVPAADPHEADWTKPGSGGLPFDPRALYDAVRPIALDPALRDDPAGVADALRGLAEELMRRDPVIPQITLLYGDLPGSAGPPPRGWLRLDWAFPTQGVMAFAVRALGLFLGAEVIAFTTETWYASTEVSDVATQFIIRHQGVRALPEREDGLVAYVEGAAPGTRAGLELAVRPLAQPTQHTYQWRVEGAPQRTRRVVGVREELGGGPGDPVVESRWYPLIVQAGQGEAGAWNDS